LTDRGFKIIAKSSMGLSVIAEKELVERVFSTKIILKTADAGTTTGHHGTMAVIFETSPVIPHEFEFCIESVKLPSPIVPL